MTTATIIGVPASLPRKLGVKTGEGVGVKMIAGGLVLLPSGLARLLPWASKAERLAAAVHV